MSLPPLVGAILLATGETAVAVEREIVPTTVAVPTPAVCDDQMQRVYEEVRAPYKYGVVLRPVAAGEYYDCPNVFRHGDKWYMLHVSIKDKVGYETCLAESDDLVN